MFDRGCSGCVTEGEFLAGRIFWLDEFVKREVWTVVVFGIN